MQLVQASGYMEVVILSIDNDSGELADGDCCHGSRSDAGCTGACHTLFVGCLRQYQSRATPEGSCTFGISDTPILGNSSFELPLDGSGRVENRNATMIFPFEFGWVVSFHFCCIYSPLP